MHAHHETEDRWMVIAIAGQGKNESAQLMLFGVSRRIARRYAKGFNQPKKQSVYPHPRALAVQVSLTPIEGKTKKPRGPIETGQKQESTIR